MHTKLGLKSPNHLTAQTVCSNYLDVSSETNLNDSAW